MGLENNTEKFDTLGENHIGTSAETPMRSDAFKLSNNEKIDIIKAMFNTLWKPLA